MATPVGHALAGLIAGAALAPAGDQRRAMIAGALAAVAADLDFIPGLIAGDPSRYHHALTHSVGFAVGLALLIGLFTRRRRLRWMVIVGTANLSHALLDVFTADPSPPYGIPLFWPFFNIPVISQVTIFPRVIHSSGHVFQAHNFAVAALETLLLGPLLLAVLVKRRAAARLHLRQTRTPS